MQTKDEETIEFQRQVSIGLPYSIVLVIDKMRKTTPRSEYLRNFIIERFAEKAKEV